MSAKKPRGGAGKSTAGTVQLHPERKPFYDACRPEYAHCLKDVCSILDQPITSATDIRVGSAPWSLDKVRETCLKTPTIYRNPAGAGSDDDAPTPVQLREKRKKAVSKTPGLETRAVFHFDRMFVKDGPDDDENATTEDAKAKEAREIQWIEVVVGGDVIVNAEEEGHGHKPVAHVEELFITENGEFMMRVRWYYRSWNTVLSQPKESVAKRKAAAVEAKAQPPKKQAKADSGEARPQRAAATKGKGKGKEAVEQAEREDSEEVTAAEEVVVVAEEDDVNKKLLPLDEERTGLDKHRLWLAKEADNEDGYNTYLEVGAVFDVAHVKYVRPGCAPPDEPDDKLHNSFWYDQEYTRQFYSFEDLQGPFHPSHAEWEQKQKRAAAPIASPAVPGPKVLNILDLCCGAGGLSFLAHRSDTVALRSRWAVDYVKDACDTYMANHPDSWVTCTGIDEYLWQSKKFVWLCVHHGLLTRRGRQRVEAAIDAALKAAPQAAANAKAGPKKVVVDVDDLRLDDAADRGTTGQAKGNLEVDLREDECWLSFRVKYSGSNDYVWAKQGDLPSGPGECPPLTRFLAQLLRTQFVPIPGDVNVIAGGPPCQGVSGLNRQAETTQQVILTDPRNRLVKTYYALVEWFEPEYVLMEQVMDTFKGSKAVYTKYAVGKLLSMRYQCRVGIIAAGQHGCPQGRYRVFTWGAKSGVVQLPAFPEPAYIMPNYKNAIPVEAKCCEVGFLSRENMAAAQPPSMMGDILEDLPEVHNFGMQDGLAYKVDKPTRPFNLYLRRSPPAYEAPLDARIKAAEVVLKPLRATQASYAISLGSFSPKLLGSLFCTKHNTEHVRGTKDVLVERRPHLETTFNAAREAYCYTLGKQIVAQAQLALPADPAASGTSAAGASKAPPPPTGPLRDHRAYTNNADDYLRMENVPVRKGASFRDMEGVCSWGIDGKIGTCCAGHTHALQHPEDHASGKRMVKLAAAAEAKLRSPHVPKAAAANKKKTASANPTKTRKRSGPAASLSSTLPTSDPTAPSTSTSLSAAAAPSPSAPPSAAPSTSGDSASFDASNPSTSAAAAAAPAGRMLFTRAKNGDVAVVSDCPGGGTTLAAQRSNDKSTRIDQRDKNGWRGNELKGCPSRTTFIATGELLCPRWCITYKLGKSAGRQACYGRLWYDDVQPTVVTRPQPHNMQLLHPTEHRVVTIRENARCQGFPDYYVLVGHANNQAPDRLTCRGRDYYPLAFPAPRAAASSAPSTSAAGAAGWDPCPPDDVGDLFRHKAYKPRNPPKGVIQGIRLGKGTEVARYKLMGNAVAPPVAAALGMCLLKAAEASAPRGEPVLSFQEPELARCLREAEELGLVSLAQSGVEVGAEALEVGADV